MSTFEKLPNEIIVKIFEYLSVEDKYRLFFDLNIRFRILVKYYTSYDYQRLDDDIRSFSTAHSWYKHLTLVNDGTTFYLIPSMGKQKRYDWEDTTYDVEHLHWHFFRNPTVPVVDPRIRRIIEKYPIKLNPFFYPNGTHMGPLTSGFNEFVERHYPMEFEKLSTIPFNRSYRSFLDLLEFIDDDIQDKLLYIYANEPKRLSKTIHNAVHHIWKELQQLNDVNVLEIQHGHLRAAYIVRMTYDNTFH